jgi:hypothetical protein
MWLSQVKQKDASMVTKTAAAAEAAEAAYNASSSSWEDC